MARLLLARERVFKERVRLVDISDDDLIKNYRLSRDIIAEILDGFRNSRWANTTGKSHALLPETQLLVALRFFAKGGFLAENADIHGVSKASVGRSVKAVAAYLSSIAPQHITLDPNNRAELAQLARDFQEVAGFPNTVGAVDGTHVLVQSPSHEEHAYVNRKSTHSINVMIVSDKNLIIRSCEARWPGSTHDAFVLRQSTLWDQFEAGRFGGYMLLGDSGYPCRRWLMTPLLNPNGRAEQRYNIAQKQTRSIVERCIGVLKSRFRCLHSSGGNLSFLPSTNCEVIMACTVLHNMARRANLPDPVYVPEDDGADADNEEQNLEDGLTVRRRIIDQF